VELIGIEEVVHQIGLFASLARFQPPSNHIHFVDGVALLPLKAIELEFLACQTVKKRPAAGAAERNLVIPGKSYSAAAACWSEFEILTGVISVDATDTEQLLHKVRHEPPPMPRVEARRATCTGSGLPEGPDQTPKGPLPLGAGARGCRAALAGR
jgi:hypothetical protein